jgi:hypothetical protein
MTLELRPKTDATERIEQPSRTWGRLPEFATVIAVAPGAEWRQIVPLARDDTRAELYRGAEQQPYRQVWLNVP